MLHYFHPKDILVYKNNPQRISFRKLYLVENKYQDMGYRIQCRLHLFHILVDTFPREYTILLLFPL